jgi:hypothetical protein
LVDLNPLDEDLRGRATGRPTRPGDGRRRDRAP